MRTGSASIEVIEDFLAQKRIALVGLSRDPASFSMFLFKELRKRGYDVVPVNPNASNILGQHCFARVQDIQPPVDAALLMTLPDVTESVVAECAAAGIRRLWMHRATGEGAVSSKAVAFCRDHGIEVVPGECPLMFLPNASTPHRLHALIRKIIFRYPKRKDRSTEKRTV